MFQESKLPTAGYKLFDKGQGTYQMLTPKGAFTGSLKDVCKFAVGLGFNLDEIELGLVEMEKNFHNGAEYGTFKTFIYTFDTKEKLPKYGTN